MFIQKLSKIYNYFCAIIVVFNLSCQVRHRRSVPAFRFQPHHPLTFEKKRKPSKYSYNVLIFKCVHCIFHYCCLTFFPNFFVFNFAERDNSLFLFLMQSSLYMIFSFYKLYDTLLLLMQRKFSRQTGELLNLQL